VPERAEPGAGDVLAGLAADLRGAFPDLSIRIDELAPRGDELHGRITISGTHSGSLWNAPPTGKRVEWTTEVTLRKAGDAFAANFDDVTPPVGLALLRQIDLVNPPDEMDRPPHHEVAFPDIVLKLAFTGQAGDKRCAHFDMIRMYEPTSDLCAQCVASGDSWPTVRMCLVCGFVGCCDTSKNKHMKQHWQETGHPIFRSLRLAEGWAWCYEDGAFFERRTLERLGATTRA